MARGCLSLAACWIAIVVSGCQLSGSDVDHATTFDWAWLRDTSTRSEPMHALRAVERPSLLGTLALEREPRGVVLSRGYGGAFVSEAAGAEFWAHDELSLHDRVVAAAAAAREDGLLAVLLVEKLGGSARAAVLAAIERLGTYDDDDDAAPERLLDAAGLSSMWSAHVYVSSGGVAALANHTTGVLVMQLAGCKEWRFCSSTQPHSTPGFARLDSCATYSQDEAALMLKNCARVVLAAGDVLYLPRRSVHTARALDDAPSVHPSDGTSVAPTTAPTPAPSARPVATPTTTPTATELPHTRKTGHPTRVRSFCLSRLTDRLHTFLYGTTDLATLSSFCERRSACESWKRTALGYDEFEWFSGPD